MAKESLYNKLFVIPKNVPKRELNDKIYKNSTKNVLGEDTKNNLSGKKCIVVASTGGTKLGSLIPLFPMLDNLGIEIIALGGSSGGSYATALRALDLSYDKMINAYMDATPKQLFDPSLLRFILAFFNKFKGFNGFAKGNAYRNYLIKHLGLSTFNACKIPLYISAFNIDKRKDVTLCKDNNTTLASAIRASGAIPILYEPELINDDLYSDGGVMKTLPITPLLDKISAEQLKAVDFVILWNVSSIDVNGHENWHDKNFSMLEIGSAAKDSLMKEIITEDIEQAKEVFGENNVYLVEPKVSTPLLATENIPNIIGTGYDTAKEFLRELNKKYEK